ncbi:hypothetical protein [Streptomyces sp. NPDC048639]|uniref:hypothetical protein n=1 Tax=Streptomyces sp. NPDC048639 TaxID=3365581 RepID=UPI0037111E1C
MSRPRTNGASRGVRAEARRVEDHASLLAELDALLPGPADRGQPYLLEVAVEPDHDFTP